MFDPLHFRFSLLVPRVVTDISEICQIPPIVQRRGRVFASAGLPRPHFQKKIGLHGSKPAFHNDMQ